MKIVFSVLFLVMSAYVVFMESERFESNSVINIRDLSQKQTTGLFDMILSQSSPVMQDSKLLELYIRSDDMLQHLNTKFDLYSYYSSKQVDVLRRLHKDMQLPMYKLTKENVLKEYNKDLFILYDGPSTALKISFAHADPHIAQQIVATIIEHSSRTLNALEKENANVALQFLKSQVQESKEAFITSIKKMMVYQNKHHTIDPNLDVQTKHTILANLESDFRKKNVEFESRSKYMVKDSIELKIAQNTLRNLRKEIEVVKREVAGGEAANELNKIVSDFQLLKNDIDFNKEVYKQSLAKLEELRSQVNQNIKNILVINPPTLADDYTYPQKFKKIFSILMVLSFIYGIFALVLSLLRDHRD
jgi:capsular polysaccharide transport system permease protein